ncbi:hypothetical protein LJK87_02565 [Paenibacillus sp. P25]|nr:hypothetical protein LJK87_02565 [Paenibacillus sp. P25]
METLKKFLAYYKPYKKALFADLFFASLASVTVLIYPLLVNEITRAPSATRELLPIWL